MEEYTSLVMIIDNELEIKTFMVPYHAVCDYEEILTKAREQIINCSDEIDEAIFVQYLCGIFGKVDLQGTKFENTTVNENLWSKYALDVTKYHKPQFGTFPIEQIYVIRVVL